MYLLLNMVIFQCHVRFLGGHGAKLKTSQNFSWFWGTGPYPTKREVRQNHRLKSTFGRGYVSYQKGRDLLYPSLPKSKILQIPGEQMFEPPKGLLRRCLWVQTPTQKLLQRLWICPTLISRTCSWIIHQFEPHSR